MSRLPLARPGRAAALLPLGAALSLVPRGGAPATPYDQGAAGAWQHLRRLATTASALHTTAHPDDEHGGVLAMLARGSGARVSLLTLNRGEAGDNAIGPELFDALGLIRTEELLVSDRYYGVDRQYFTTVIDYGFSKRLEEALEKWGREHVLRDVVRVIRIDRPFVVISRFQGNARDGHGNHQTAGLVTQEAFEAAADPARFPEQIAEGLRAAHEAGVIHRDLKPENVMVDGDGRAVIMDFGISRSATGAMATLAATAPGAVVGTLEYMAPEQAAGGPVDARADLYALGLILLDLLAGREWLSDSYSVLDPYAFTFYSWGLRRELPMRDMKNYTAFKDRMMQRPAVQRIVEEFRGLDEIIAASDEDLEAVEGVGDLRAKEIREGLRRLQEINLVDRYLQT